MARRFILLLALACGLVAAPAHAAVLLINRLTPATIGVGDSAVFEVRIAGLSSALGAFSVDIQFDGEVLDFVPAANASLQFGTRLGDPLTDSVSSAFVISPGLLHIDQVSLLGEASLDALQRDASGALLSDFVLADIRFTGRAGGGFSLLEAVPNSVVLSDSLGIALPGPLLGSSGVKVVTVPSTALLAALGLALVALRARSASRSRR